MKTCCRPINNGHNPSAVIAGSQSISFGFDSYIPAIAILFVVLKADKLSSIMPATIDQPAIPREVVRPLDNLKLLDAIGILERARKLSPYCNVD